MASFASTVMEAFAEGDEVARDILTSNAERLAQVIGHATTHYPCGNKIILAGGIVSEGSPFLTVLRPLLPADKTIVLPKNPQVLGACVLCAQMCELDATHLIEKFPDQYRFLKEKKDR